MRATPLKSKYIYINLTILEQYNSYQDFRKQQAAAPQTESQCTCVRYALQALPERNQLTNEMGKH